LLRLDDPIEHRTHLIKEYRTQDLSKYLATRNFQVVLPDGAYGTCRRIHQGTVAAIATPNAKLTGRSNHRRPYVSLVVQLIREESRMQSIHAPWLH